MLEFIKSCLDNLGISVDVDLLDLFRLFYQDKRERSQRPQVDSTSSGTQNATQDVFLPDVQEVNERSDSLQEEGSKSDPETK